MVSGYRARIASCVYRHSQRGELHTMMGRQMKLESLSVRRRASLPMTRQPWKPAGRPNSAIPKPQPPPRLSAAELPGSRRSTLISILSKHTPSFSLSPNSTPKPHQLCLYEHLILRFSGIETRSAIHASQSLSRSERWLASFSHRPARIAKRAIPFRNRLELMLHHVSATAQYL